MSKFAVLYCNIGSYYETLQLYNNHSDTENSKPDLETLFWSFSEFLYVSLLSIVEPKVAEACRRRTMYSNMAGESAATRACQQNLLESIRAVASLVGRAFVCSVFFKLQLLSLNSIERQVYSGAMKLKY